MKLHDIIHEAAEFLKAVPYLAGVPVVEEEKGDPTSEVHLKVGQQKSAVLVGWSGAEPVKQSGDRILVEANIIVSIFERPAVNRKSTPSSTIGNMAIAVAKALTYAKADDMECPLFLKKISPISEASELGGGTVVCFVVFRTKAEL